jgi:hypothetical protein
MLAAPALAMSFRPRVAIATSFPHECASLAEWLASEGFEPIRLPSGTPRLTDELKQCALDLLIVEAPLASAAINALRARGAQAPILVIGPPDPAAEAQAMARGAIYLARPIDRTLLVCTVSIEIAESRPVRRSERRPTRLSVVVQGVASQIIDVSREGMRIEIPRTASNAPPPPVFGVAVPMLGVALNVRRLWTATPPDTIKAIWYGGELSNNSRRAELAWFTLVDALQTSRTKLELR